MVEGVLGNVKRYITPKKTFGYKLVSLLLLFFLFFIIDRIEDSPQGVDLDTKKG
jgi:hypothetical protein